ncbi:methylated-DNA--[protein]-cysteine S-methyltransferase [Streptococcus catagoni]|uniref:methylated-DNA--[protein]-cysteine S-methyltransferase n=1 Tax=Streptococcus catagoni TaxID=2654874 RepID=UPI00140D1947|nr:methylated-DNA--[protein]-cysteine S-methyltransferase [Streptococcus catagoni]
MPLYKTIYKSPIGDLSLVANQDALIGSWFVNQKFFEASLACLEEELLLQGHPILDLAIEWLDAYFAGEHPEQATFLQSSGSPFQEKVWSHLQLIPEGGTQTYGRIARDINCKSAQAVGGAVGKNPLSIFIPCHRVLASNGALTGYAAGIDRKIWLLNHESKRGKKEKK